MKRMILFIVIAIMTMSFVATAFADSEKARDHLPEELYNEPAHHGEVHKLQYLDGRRLFVWTPYNYNASTKYTVILLIHGDGGNADNWLNDEHHFGGTYSYKAVTTGSDLFDRIVEEGKCKPFIVASIDAQFEKYGNGLLDDIPYAYAEIVDNFSTYAKDSSTDSLIAARDHFILGGLSRGGGYVHKFMLKHPEYVNNYICMSGTNNIYQLVDMFKEGYEPFNKVFFCAGKKGHQYKATCESYRALSPYLKSSVLKEYKFGHDWNTWNIGIYDAIHFMLEKEPISIRLRIPIRFPDKGIEFYEFNLVA